MDRHVSGTSQLFVNCSVSVSFAVGVVAHIVLLGGPMSPGCAGAWSARGFGQMREKNAKKYFKHLNKHAGLKIQVK